MGVISIHFRDSFLDLYESEIVDVTDRQIGKVNGEMSETDSFGLYYMSEHSSVVYQFIPVMGITSWDYYPSTLCDKVENHYKETDDPVFENLRKKLAVIAHNNEVLRAVKDLE